MKEEEDRKGVHIDINKFSWLEMRRILWKHSLSVQEFFSYLAKLLITGDKRLYDLVVEARNVRAKNEVPNIIHTDEESLYNLIEQMRGQREITGKGGVCDDQESQGNRGQHFNQDSDVRGKGT